MKTKPIHFEKFQGYCWHWIEKFSLRDWRVHFEHVELANDTAAAQVDFNVPQHQVTVTLNKVWKQQVPTDDLLHRNALHEVLHIALMDMLYLGSRREYSDDELARVEHAFIARVENLLLGAMK